MGRVILSCDLIDSPRFVVREDTHHRRGKGKYVESGNLEFHFSFVIFVFVV
jgi:hypothetical protein